MFINCMNGCGKLIEISPELANKVLRRQDPPEVMPEYLIVCCECAFNKTSEQLLQEN